MQTARQLQGVEAEHGEGQQHEHHRETDQHIGVLQRSLEFQARRGHYQPQQGVGDRHPLHIDKGEQEGATGREAMAGTGDDAGQDWVHGEDAGGEGEPQPQCEEGDDAEPEPLIAEGSGQLILLANRCDALCRFSSGCCGCRDQRGHIDQLVGRRVAEAVGTALIAHPQGGIFPHLF